MKENLEKLLAEYKAKIEAAQNLKELDGVFLELFGKSGEITLFSKNFAGVSKDELKEIVPLFNKVKSELEEEIHNKRNEIREEDYKKLEKETLELTEIAASHVHVTERGPRKDVGGGTEAETRAKPRKGKLHVLTEIENDIARIFRNLGFEQYDSPHIDSDHYNFEVLNIPEQHPARDLWDTLYIESGVMGHGSREDINPGKMLLRTHLSNSQVRIMEDFRPPFRKMVLGRCFRKENLDARHEHTFEQFELVYVDKGLSMANLQYLSEVFLKEVFGSDIKVRLKPKYYPFVEPGAGVDGLCIFCKGEGCKICGGVGWLELAGAGMIHPNVLKAGGIDPNEYSGIAWGFGPSRMAMLKYGVEDVREFNSGIIHRNK